MVAEISLNPLCFLLSKLLVRTAQYCYFKTSSWKYWIQHSLWCSFKKKVLPHMLLRKCKFSIVLLNSARRCTNWNTVTTQDSSLLKPAVIFSFATPFTAWRTVRTTFWVPVEMFCTRSKSWRIVQFWWALSLLHSVTLWKARVLSRETVSRNRKRSSNGLRVRGWVAR